jgi:hypothetical protein
MNIAHYPNKIYDATNGTISEGHIFRSNKGGNGSLAKERRIACWGPDDVRTTRSRN